MSAPAPNQWSAVPGIAIICLFVTGFVALAYAVTAILRPMFSKGLHREMMTDMGTAMMVPAVNSPHWSLLVAALCFGYVAHLSFRR